MPDTLPTEDQLYDTNATRPDSMVVWMGVLKLVAANVPIMDTKTYMETLFNMFLLFATTVMRLFGARTIVQCPVAALNNPRLKYVQLAVVPYESKPDLQTPPSSAAGLIYNTMHGALYDMEKSLMKTPILLNRAKAQADPTKTAYYLFETNADWTKGSCLFFVGLRNPQQAPTPSVFIAQVRKCMMTIQDNQLPGQDGAFFACDGEVVFYGEHFRTPAARSAKNVELLALVAETLVLSEPTDVQAPDSIEATATSYTFDGTAPVLRHLLNVPQRANLEQHL